ncbi:MAG: hypothetical protein K1X57_11815 [Gemmataceae bacterium]|nr:hypothetical protein [Gemmataceae bacterium]
MPTSTVSVELDPETGRVYDEAPDEVKLRLKLILSHKAREVFQKSNESLKEIMDEVGIRATAMGLTEEELEKMLRDE